jgi:uncharacterized phage protein (TIGR02216 family)
MQFGFGVLHLSSDAFWKMTPRELAQAIIAVHGRAPAPIAREDFDALMQAFPDGVVMRGLDPPAGPKPLRRGEGPRIHQSSQESFEVDGLPGQARQ